MSSCSLISSKPFDRLGRNDCVSGSTWNERFCSTPISGVSNLSKASKDALDSGARHFEQRIVFPTSTGSNRLFSHVCPTGATGIGGRDLALLQFPVHAARNFSFRGVRPFPLRKYLSDLLLTGDNGPFSKRGMVGISIPFECTDNFNSESSIMVGNSVKLSLALLIVDLLN